MIEQQHPEVEFEASVYAHFSEELHKYVEQALFYEGEQLRSGEISFQEFAQAVSCHAVKGKEDEARALDADIMFQGVRQLVLTGKIDDPKIVAELNAELRQGADSLLARFISVQPVISTLDAAISFLGWKRAKALIELENVFEVNLDMFREKREPELFCTSENLMSLANFSVLSE